MRRKGIYLSEPIWGTLDEVVLALRDAGIRLSVLDDKGKRVKRKPSDTSFISKSIEILGELLIGDVDRAREILRAIRPDLFEVPAEGTIESLQASGPQEPHT